MKFNFEKHIKEEPKQENTELTQEQFDEQIMAEANKLGTNLEQLKSEIDQYGGSEKFKEHFEQPTNFSGNNKEINKAGQDILNLEFQEKREKRESRDMASLGAVMVGITAFFDYVVAVGAEGQASQFMHQLDTLKESWANNPTLATAAVAMVALVAVPTGALISSAIKHRIEARKVNREKQKEDLKFKMTGTEVKNGQL